MPAVVFFLVDEGGTTFSRHPCLSVTSVVEKFSSSPCRPLGVGSSQSRKSVLAQPPPNFFPKREEPSAGLGKKSRIPGATNANDSNTVRREDPFERRELSFSGADEGFEKNDRTHAIAAAGLGDFLDADTGLERCGEVLLRPPGGVGAGRLTPCALRGRLHLGRNKVQNHIRPELPHGAPFRR
jgi:hypothetical protein